MTTVAAEFDHIELQQQYSSIDTVNNRWDDDWDNENSSARLFERSRIKALAGCSTLLHIQYNLRIEHHIKVEQPLKLKYYLKVQYHLKLLCNKDCIG